MKLHDSTPLPITVRAMIAVGEPRCCSNPSKAAGSDAIVSVDLDRIPTERFEFLHDRFDIHHIRDLSVDLYVIPTDDEWQTIQLVVR